MGRHSSSKSRSPSKSKSRSRSKSKSHSPSKSKSRSRSKSASKSRSRSRSRSKRRSRTPRRYRGRSRSMSPEGFRVHVADLGLDCSKREIEKRFEKFGPTYEIWLARNPPCFAFVVYKYREDADEAVKQMDGEVVSNSRVRVSHARPRTKPRFGVRRRGYDPNLRCYQCGERGHFARDCYDVRRSSGYRASERFRSYRSRSRSRDRDRRRRSRSRSARRSRSRSRSAEKKERKESESPKKSPRKSPKKAKRSKSRSRSRSASVKNGSGSPGGSKWENRDASGSDSN